VTEFIKLLPEGGKQKARQGTGLGDGRSADGAVWMTVNGLSELLPGLGRLQISRLIGS
jgi:hypothetical protein